MKRRSFLRFLGFSAAVPVAVKAAEALPKIPEITSPVKLSPELTLAPSVRAGGWLNMVTVCTSDRISVKTILEDYQSGKYGGNE